jgi:hypothetical protein
MHVQSSEQDEAFGGRIRSPQEGGGGHWGNGFAAWRAM